MWPTGKYFSSELSYQACPPTNPQELERSRGLEDALGKRPDQPKFHRIPPTYSIPRKARAKMD
jgi:hypothetical protein